MVEFEFLNEEANELPPAGVETGQSGGRHRWWLLAIPALLIALVVGVLGRDAPPQAEEALEPDAAIDETPVSSFVVDDPQPVDRLLASFYDKRLLSGTLNGSVVASSIDGEHEVELPLIGVPLIEVDGWLVLHQEGQVVAVDLREVVPEPVTLLELDGQPDGLLVRLSGDILSIGLWSEQEVGFIFRGFEIGTWSAIPLGVSQGVSLNGVSPFSLLGNGVFVFEGGAFERLGIGSILAADRTRSLVRECDGWNQCELSIYDNDVWEKLEELDPNLDVGEYGTLVPDSDLLLTTNWPEPAVIVDLETGRSVILHADFNPYYGQTGGKSEIALLGRDHEGGYSLADIETGETFKLGGPSFGALITYYEIGPVAVDVDLPLIKVWLDPTDYPTEAEIWDRIDGGAAEPRGQTNTGFGRGSLSVEPYEGDQFAVGLPVGSVIGVRSYFDGSIQTALVIDLSDGSGIALGGFGLMSIVEDYAVGSLQVNDPTETGLAVYNRKSEQLYVLDEGRRIEQAAPGADANTVWTVSVEEPLSAEGSLSVIRLIDLDDSGAELARFETVDSVRLFGHHGSDPLVAGDASGVFRLSEDGIESLGSGTVLANGGSSAVLGRCDEGLVCHAELIGDLSGRFDIDSSLLPPQWRTPTGAMSQGRLMIHGGDEWQILDLESGDQIDAGFGESWGGAVEVGSTVVYVSENGSLSLLDGMSGVPAGPIVSASLYGLVVGPPSG